MSEDSRIGANDLVNMASIIEICSQRGAFKANELKLVGTLHEKLANFIETMRSKQEEAEEANADQEGQTPTAEENEPQQENVKNV